MEKKHGRGRPRLDGKEQRRNRVGANLTDTEYLNIILKAEKMGVSVSDYLRRLIRYDASKDYLIFDLEKGEDEE